MKKVAIIDNYISAAEVYELTGRRISCHYADDNYRNNENNGRYGKTIFHHSHGTICASILSEYVGETVQIHALSVSEENGDIVMDNVCKAFHWCRENNIDSISISIGTETWDDIGKLAYETQELVKHGVQIFSACSNNGLLSFPSAFPWVMGVAYCEKLHGIAECRESLLGINLLSGYFPSNVLREMEKENTFYAKRSNSMAVPYILSCFLSKEFPNSIMQLKDDSIIWHSESNLWGKIKKDISAPIVRLAGKQDINRRLALFFQKAGYRTGLVTDRGEADVSFGIIKVQNEYEIERAVLILAKVDILFLDIAQKSWSDERVMDAAFDMDEYTIEGAYKAIRKMFGDIEL